MSVEKTMNHTDYMANVKTMDEQALAYFRDDARRAMEAMPDGVNAGYYADEVHYCNMELVRRRNESRARQVKFREWQATLDKNTFHPRQ